MRKYTRCKLFTLVLLTGISFLAGAQSRPWDNGNAATNNTPTNNETANISNSNAGVFSFGAGIGYSTFYLRIYGFDESGQNGTPIPLSETPAYNFLVDYGINQKTCVGVGFTYQHATGTPQFPENSPDTITAIEQITRWNVGVRLVHYTGNDINYSFYYGGRIGVSYWQDVLPSYLSGDERLGGAQKFLPSFQFFCGYRIVIAKYLALHAEFAIGAPYLVETGISFRI
jgi:hypothetical protein